MNQLQHSVTIFQEWCEQQIAGIAEMENEKDNNSYEAPHDLMLLQGKRRVLEHNYTMTGVYLEDHLAKLIEHANKMMKKARENLEAHRSERKIHGHMSLKHARTLGEYSMLCDIERKLLSLE